MNECRNAEPWQGNLECSVPVELLIANRSRGEAPSVTGRHVQHGNSISEGGGGSVNPEPPCDLLGRLCGTMV